jgi:hypothetical protein
MLAVVALSSGGSGAAHGFAGSIAARGERGNADRLFLAATRRGGALLRSTAPSARAGKALCVGKGHHCFSTIQAALDAAQDGDKIKIDPGTFAGGITIDKNVSLTGSGADATTISGGGPVITIGQFLAPDEPTVTISGVTVTGGSTSSSAQADLFFGVPGAWAIGGGVYIVPAEDFSPGATVTISDSVITGNRVAPIATIGPTEDQLPFWPVCPTGPCPFAGASGGGIADDGNLTLTHTTVSDNQAVGPASDADGGGIWVGFAGGSLTLHNSTISGNLAWASDPNGRFAEGGGLFTAFGDTVTIADSRVTGNTASLSSSFPYFVGDDQTLEIAVNSGGVHMGNGGSLTIANSQIDDNTVTATALNGEPEVFDSGLCGCGDSTLTLRDSSISNNHLTATLGSNADVFASVGFSAGGALEFDGPATVRNARILDNTTVVTSPSGAAIANGTVANFFSDSTPVLVRDSTISGNSVSASSSSGSAVILGVGVVEAGNLELRNDRIAENTGTANAPSGIAQGAGVWAGPFPGGPPVALTLEDTKVTRNALSGGAGITLQGGGLFASIPVTLIHSRIVKNTPDDCFGTSC